MIKQTTNRIFVTFQKEGIHCYPDALYNECLNDVCFLGHPHRHIFHFRVEIDVFHDDRDIEFIQFKRWLESLYSDGILHLNHKSCEMISNDLSLVIHEKFPNRNFTITVAEDNENGSVTSYEVV